ncbi:hypothetical protein PVAG01_07524 [Phlyctema vagabunda]|uniref:Reticulon-like protein n=1 Tax=Phlyctema vagabunda TaxID=108571 RepID=A0ABR4PCT3_9HELO
MTLGVTVAAEVAGKSLFNQGLTSQFRPKKYYTLPKQTLDNLLGDVHELINFFVIESQRIVFAENVFASVAAFFGAFLSYYLIKIVPFWGMSLIATSVVFLAPLIYKTNKELIDHHVNNASHVVNQQTKQVKELASQQAARATEFTKQSVGDYSAKAQDLVASARGRSSSPVATTKSAKTDVNSAFKSDNTSGLKNDHSAFKTESSPVFQPETIPALKSEDFPSSVNAPLSSDPSSTYKHDDFPAAPKEDFKSTPVADEFVTKDFNKTTENEPLFTS